MDFFKAICGVQLVDGEEVPHVGEISLIDSQETIGVICSRDDLEDQ